MARTDYYHAYPQGDPEAVFCRGCNAPRIRHRGVYLCRTCDGPAHLVKGQAA